ncbi:pyridoxal 5'-phosphate synthase glutaminase subunit PdxT [Terriglobus albidus]|uniref:Pyridoxal 5'-phosphate synthase subunit PdxT n=1 Tax=Terriglobus albidus TaxID=1592106 RepID=A0A5B9EC57_9BACT|nr:pyridoxal 5'-phosphate synthase glutaminase subunit PdxT [Terriglobus albidus]QEE29224.1 pyridoxal 5'-phosphate synthase glutaminase subunit PdxT [Terriglobus albidus]
MTSEHLTIGVLAVQGAFEAHAQVLRSLGVNAPLVRLPEDLASLDGLILPGGESTTFLKHLERNGFFDALGTFVRHRPSFGTCAGTILLAKDVRNPVQKSLAVLDATVERNAYGRQIDSTIQETETTLPGGPMEMVYIRAPRIASVGDGVEVLARRNGDPVLVREGRILAATFHPELSADRRVHELFVEMVRQDKLAHSATEAHAG